MGARGRAAASGYIEAFVLIGVALGGTGIVFAATSTYASTLQGAAISVTGASLSQGAYVALEKLTVDNTGTTQISSFTISTNRVPASASYCYWLLDPATAVTVASTCPTMSTNPTTLTLPYVLSPGRALLVELTILGGTFAIGSNTLITVTTASGAQESLSVQVVPA